MTLGEKVKQLRLEQKMTQEQLAKKMGYSNRSSINLIENGRDVSQKIIIRLADALNTTPSYLMGWEEKELWYHAQSKEEIEALSIMENLSVEEFVELLNYLRYIVSKRQKYE